MNTMQSLSPVPASNDLRLEFQEASLGTVLRYFREEAGLMIHASSNVPMERTLDLWCDRPVSRAEALALLDQVLAAKGCTLIPRGPLFSIIRSQDVKKTCIPLPAL
jgi:hypothetical protein